MDKNIMIYKNERGESQIYKKSEDGKWSTQSKDGEWFQLKGEPPARVLGQARKMAAANRTISSEKVIPFKKQKNSNFSNYRSFFVGNSEWFGNKLFAALPPSGPWILQYIISQIIRDTSNSWKFGNAEMLNALSEKHYLWANISLNKIMEKTGASRPTVVKVLKKAEQLGAILSVSGVTKGVDNNIYICGIKSYSKYDPGQEKREWLFVDSPYANEEGEIPEQLLKPLRVGLLTHHIMVDGLDLIKSLFHAQGGVRSSEQVVKKLN